jgi:predicted PurR-regulated permease PerM
MPEFDRRITFNITSAAVFKILLIVVLFVFLYFVRDLVVIVLTSIVIASAVEPMIVWFKKFRVARTIAVILIYVFIIFVVAGFFYLLLPSILSDLSNLLSNLPKYLDAISIWNPLKTDVVNNSAPVVKSLSAGSSFSLGDLAGSFNSAIANTSAGLVQTLSVVFGGVLSLILIVVLSFYFAVQEDGVATFLKIVLPIRHEEYILNLWQRSRHKIGRWLQGQLLLGLLIGILVYLGLTILGMPNALLLALFAAAFEIIPVFGPILSAIPSTLVALTESGPTLALLVIGFYIIIHQFENQLIYPLVVKKIVGIPPILVILALIIGFKLAGVLGIILSVPISAVLVEILDDVQKDKRARAVKPATLL